MGEKSRTRWTLVKDFQEHPTADSTCQHMISGSVSGVKEADELPAVDMSPEDSPGILVDGFERTHDGVPASATAITPPGTARLLSAIRPQKKASSLGCVTTSSTSAPFYGCAQG
ncbi:zinc finger protein Pegasus [Lates japonicus]|uniref:Zinc finger protein Pegasus n=1 Tax=Lates japonicus TaxID=270547 RepID=A0AAD3RNQ9_LATJO|nr:zinc finger protein Pegasus [Lates japonicus]